MSVINKREFFLIWTKQTLKNIQYRYNCVNKSTLGQELLRDDLLYLQYKHMNEAYADQMVTSQMIANPIFMLDMLIAHNDQEFFKLDAMMVDSQMTQDSSANSGSPNRRYPGTSILNQQPLTVNQKECLDHLLQLIKLFFEKRQYDGKNLFRVLQKCCDQEDIRIKVYELVFVICFFCKDIDMHRFDIYCEQKEQLSIFNMSTNNLYEACNPMLTKCIFQIIGDTLKQFTLSQDEIEQTVYFIGSEDLFMKNRYKLNINDSQSILDEQHFGKDDVLIKGDIKPASRFVFPDQGDTATHSRKPSHGGTWKEISIDTLNLTPKSSRSKTNSPFNYRHQPPQIEQSRLLKSPNAIFNVFKQNPAQVKDLDAIFKIEELESQVFLLTSENTALKKGIDQLEDALTKSKEEMEQAIQDHNQYATQDLDEVRQQLRDKDQAIKLMEDEIGHIHSELEFYISQQEAFENVKVVNRELQQVKEKLESELDCLQSQITKIDSELVSKQKEIKRLTNQLSFEQDQHHSQVTKMKLEFETQLLQQKKISPQVLKSVEKIQRIPEAKKQSTQFTQVNEDLLGIETVADKYDILKSECHKLKLQNSKVIDKLSFYKEKSMRLDDTVVVHDSKIEKLRNTKANLQEHINELQNQMLELQDKYQSKKKKAKMFDASLQRFHKENKVYQVGCIIASLVALYFIIF